MPGVEYVLRSRIFVLASASPDRDPAVYFRIPTHLSRPPDIFPSPDTLVPVIHTSSSKMLPHAGRPEMESNDGEDEQDYAQREYIWDSTGQKNQMTCHTSSRGQSGPYRTGSDPLSPSSVATLPTGQTFHESSVPRSMPTDATKLMSSLALQLQTEAPSPPPPPAPPSAPHHHDEYASMPGEHHADPSWFEGRMNTDEEVGSSYRFTGIDDNAAYSAAAQPLPDMTAALCGIGSHMGGESWPVSFDIGPDLNDMDDDASMSDGAAEPNSHRIGPVAPLESISERRMRDQPAASQRHKRQRTKSKERAAKTDASEPEHRRSHKHQSRSSRPTAETRPSRQEMAKGAIRDIDQSTPQVPNRPHAPSGLNTALVHRLKQTRGDGHGLVASDNSVDDGVGTDTSIMEDLMVDHDAPQPSALQKKGGRNKKETTEGAGVTK